MRIWMILGGVALAGSVVLLGVREQRRAKEVAALTEQMHALAERALAAQTTRGANVADPAALAYRMALAAGQQTAADAARESPAGGPGAEAAKAAKEPVAELPPAMTENEMRTHLDVAVARAAPNPEWSRAMRQDLSEHLRTHPGASDSRLRSVDCKDSICRVEMLHASRADYERFMNDAVLAPATAVWSTPSFTSLEAPSPDGSLLAVSYVSKENQGLPLDD